MKWLFIALLLISCTDRTEEMKLFISGLQSQTGGITPVYGCTDPSAENYNPLATHDDGSCTYHFPENGVYVYLLTGQSNAEGRAPNTSALSSEIDSTSDMLIWRNTAFANLNISASNNYSSGGAHGRELGMSQSLFNGKPIYLIKYGYSGSPISDHLSGGSVYTIFWDRVVNGINNLINAGKRPFVYLGFHQGEADGTTALYSSHATKLDAWVELWRNNLGADLPITVTEIKETLTNSYVINDNFHAKALTDPLFDVIDAKNETTLDGIHLDYQAQKNVASQVLSLMATTTPIEITSLLPLSNPPAQGTILDVVEQ